MKQNGYGPHLMIDCYGCPRELLESLEHVYEFLDKSPMIIGMTKITPPYVFIYNGTVAEEWGVTGVVLIAESHLTVHTYPEQGVVFLDVFSCRPFNTDTLKEHCVGHFKPENFDDVLVYRGREFRR